MTGLMLALWAVVGLAVAPPRGDDAAAHPIHSSTLIIRDGTQPGQLAIELRAFLEDFPPGERSEAIERYLADKVTIQDRAGSSIRLRYLRHRTEAGVLRVTLHATAPAGLAGGSIRNRLVQEKFADQVNLVDVAIGGRHALMVFLGSDGAKPII